jgi:hypothetical protein
MKNYFYSIRQIILAIILGFAGLLAGMVPATAQETIRQYLSGTDGEHTVPWDFFCSDGRNSGVWTNIAVPSCWELQGFGKFRYGHEDKNYTPIRGDYRHSFNVPADWRSQRVFIVFAGVMTDASVKINGTEAGPVHQGAFYRFKYDITSLLKFGETNLLEVSVSDKSADNSVNGAERYADYWVFGGIFRPVWLQAEPAQFVDRVAIDARADGTFALDYYLGGEGKADGVEVTLQDTSGKMVGEPVSVPVAANRITTKISAPKLWTAETPNLYTAVVQLKQGANVLHELKQRFGFRTIEVRRGEGLFVNGQHVLLKGVCHHVAWPTLGRSSSDRIAELDVNLIQEMNMNAVRCSHYPPDEKFLDLCDEKGLYVLDELTGWQHKYDTDVGREHVKEMISRDVNHPSIIIWDNGNEGGWNTNLDADFTELDPQHRAVNHPWAAFGNIDDKHYPDYKALKRGLSDELVYMPTEFLHGLYDGGAGAGLDDYWNAMRASKVSAGGFLWVFADEGVERGDMNNFIDVKGNQAPDGILGPFRQKEASFYTIKQIWSPVQLPQELPADFDGTLQVENRYHFTSLAQCKFTWQLRKFGHSAGFETIAEGGIASPEVAPGKTGKLKLDLPTDWKSADALAVTARDSNGQELWTWVYPLQPQSKYAPAGSPVAATTTDDELKLKSGDTEARVDAATGQLLGVKVGGKDFSLTSEPISNAKWTMLDSGWLKLDYSVDPAVQTNVVGVAFNYPEEKMLAKTWLGDGPYRVWRNRLKGQELGVWKTAYNTTETGYKDWIYPEFAGYFANVRWLKLATTEGALTLMIPDQKTFVRVGTPEFPPAKLAGKTLVKMPPGDLAVVRDIPPMGTKFHTAAQIGPQGTTPLVTAPYQGTVYFHFDPVAATAVLPGNGLAQHDFFYAGEAKTRDMFIVRGGKVVWSYHDDAGKGEISDAQLLSNGNVLFAHQFGVTLIAPDKTVLWNYDAPLKCEIHTAQMIGTNHVIFIQNGPQPKIFVANLASGLMEKEIPLTAGNNNSTHGQFRHARLTDAGTYLVTHMDMGKIVEYDENGNAIWSTSMPRVWSATRLKNGNTVCSGGGEVREINSAGKTVWEFTAADMPGYNFNSIQIATRLPNGNTLINNWVNEWNGAIDPATAPAQAIEVTPDKKIVWALRSWTNPALGPSTTIQLLDEPDAPEDVHFGSIK